MMLFVGERQPIVLTGEDSKERFNDWNRIRSRSFRTYLTVSGIHSPRLRCDRRIQDLEASGAGSKLAGQPGTSLERQPASFFRTCARGFGLRQKSGS